MVYIRMKKEEHTRLRGLEYPLQHEFKGRDNEREPCVLMISVIAGEGSRGSSQKFGVNTRNEYNHIRLQMRERKKKTTGEAKDVSSTAGCQWETHG